MAAGFFLKSLANLLTSSARWVEWADGSAGPVHGAVALDPATGLALDYSQPAPVTLPDSRTLTSSDGLLSITTLTAGAQNAADPAAKLFEVDMSGYNSLSVSVDSAGAGNTIVFEGSNNGSTWYAVAGFNVGSSNGAQHATSVSSSNTLQFRRTHRRLRARVATYGSGVITVSGEMAQAPAVYPPGATLGPSSDGGTLNNPIGVAFEARTASKGPIANNRVVQPIADKQGRVVVQPKALPEETWAASAPAGGSISNTTSATALKAAVVGFRNVIDTLDVSHDVLGAATEIVVLDDTTVIWRGRLQTPATEGFTRHFDPPLRGSVNKALNIATPAAVTGAIYASAQGHLEL